MANANTSTEVFNYREFSIQITWSSSVSVLCCDSEGSGGGCSHTGRCLPARACHAGFCLGRGCREQQLRHPSRCPESETVSLPSRAPRTLHRTTQLNLHTSLSPVHTGSTFPSVLNSSPVATMKSKLGVERVSLAHIWRP